MQKVKKPVEHLYNGSNQPHRIGLFVDALPRGWAILRFSNGRKRWSLLFLQEARSQEIVGIGTIWWTGAGVKWMLTSARR
jgi:hypothetical protein